MLQTEIETRGLNGMVGKTVVSEGWGRAASPDGSRAASVTMRLCLRTELINCACALMTYPWAGPSTSKHLSDGTNKGRAGDRSFPLGQLSARSLISQKRHKNYGGEHKLVLVFWAQSLAKSKSPARLHATTPATLLKPLSHMHPEPHFQGPISSRGAVFGYF